MQRLLVIGALLLASLRAAAADDRTVVYRVTLDEPQTQMVELAMTIPRVAEDELDVCLPIWRPGRYVVLDPAGTVRGVSAADAGTGEPLAVEKVEKSTWRIATRGAAAVTVTWRVYANSLGDRTRHVDETHAFLSPTSVFMYAPSRRGDPVRVEIEAPADWRIATGLESAPGRALVAPDYDVLADSPIEIGIHDAFPFDVDGVPHEIVAWPAGRVSDARAETMCRDVATIIRAARDVFGSLPYRRYVFLLHVGAGAGGGTEHLNSTIIQTSRRSMEDDAAYRRFLSVVAHEFFHTWNVKQLRPAGLHPYDYQRENYTDLLWVAEGTTSYYDDLLLARTGLLKERAYLDQLARAIDGLRERPGAAVQSLSESSFDAWIKFNRSTPDDANSSVSFYSKGALVSLLLDLEVRRTSEGAATLDDVFRAMFERFPLSGPGYTTADLQTVCEELAGGPLDAFFASYVRGTDDLPFEKAFDVVGLELVFEPAKDEDEDEDEDESEGGEDEDENEDENEGEGEGENEDEDEGENGVGVPGSARDDGAPDDSAPVMRAILGLSLADEGGRTVVRSVGSDGPAYRAGIIAGDEIVALDGRRLGARDLDGRLELYGPGDRVELLLFRRDEIMTRTVRLDGRRDGSLKLRRVKEPTDAQQAAYESWLARPPRSDGGDEGAQDAPGLGDPAGPLSEPAQPDL